MLKKLNRKCIILLVLVISFLFFLNTAYALECGGVCYPSGVCCNNVWYKGCEASNGNLYCPLDYLGDCLTCECTSPSSCEWQPDYQICQYQHQDLICTSAGTPPSSSACVDRDTSSGNCTDTTCSYYGTWTKAGESDTSYQTAIWEYTFGDKTTFECCGDDDGEYYVTQGVGTGACCDSNAKCVDSGNVCRENADEDLVPNGCSDGIDNDCDGLIDCADADCAGQAGPGNVLCCQTASNCVQDDCKIESCVSNVCSYANRPAGATDECSTCQECNAAGGNCAGITANDGKNCVDDCSYCNAGKCDNRLQGATDECDTCQECNAAGGNCIGINAETGKGCTLDCYDCVSGACAPKTENNDGNCNDDCTSCNAGSCSNRNQCVSTECASGYYCNATGGDCKTPDENEKVCLNCVADQTSGAWTWVPPNHEDAGKAYSTNTDVYTTLFNSDSGSCVENDGTNCFGSSTTHKSALTTGLCCGDDANEFYKPDYYGGECTNNVNDCVWGSGGGDAQASDSGNEKYWCYLHEWYECNSANIGTTKGSVCCAGTSAAKAWALSPLPENQYSCSDGIDNDCDGNIDQADQPDCCTDITRECKTYTKQEFELIHKKKKTPQHWKNLQTINGNYYACVPNDFDTACCENPNSCVYNGVCYDDRAKLDVDGDGVNEICVASSPGQWVDDFELDCSNGIDDDFDGLIDCADPDCSGSISGRVQDTDAKNIGGARVDAVQAAILKYTEFTQASGKYQIDAALCGNYDMIASADGYVSSTTNINLQPNEQLQNVDFTLVPGSTCEDDCTYAGDNIIHRDCDGVNGCEFCPVKCKFCDPQKVADSCDLAQPGWIRDYNDPANCPDGCVIECAENCPEAKRAVKAKVTCEKENLIKMTKVVTYKGKLVKLVVVTCG